ncbi:MAG: fasciclin domain-containing protein [Candidatus Krumholzibacteriia bacterium]
MSDSPSIFDLAGQAGFTTLTAAIEAAGLRETLTTDGPFTVFAPTDEAFAKLPAGTVESLLADKDALTKVLLFHVTNGSVYAADVMDLRAARTLNGEKVAINLNNGVQINDANVIKTDVQASNGVIHVIDTVLIPANL